MTDDALAAVIIAAQQLLSRRDTARDERAQTNRWSMAGRLSKQDFEHIKKLSGAASRWAVSGRLQ